MAVKRKDSPQGEKEISPVKAASKEKSGNTKVPTELGGGTTNRRKVPTELGGGTTSSKKTPSKDTAKAKPKKTGKARYNEDVQKAKKMSKEDVSKAEDKVKNAKKGDDGDYLEEDKAAAREVRTKRGTRTNPDGSNYGATGQNSELTASLDDFITLMARGNAGTEFEYTPPAPPPTAAPMGVDTAAQDYRREPVRQQAQGGMRGSNTRSQGRQDANQGMDPQAAVASLRESAAQSLDPFINSLPQRPSNRINTPATIQPTQNRGFMQGAGDALQGFLPSMQPPQNAREFFMSLPPTDPARMVYEAVNPPTSMYEAGQQMTNKAGELGLGAAAGRAGGRAGNQRGAANHEQVRRAYQNPVRPQTSSAPAQRYPNANTKEMFATPDQKAHIDSLDRHMRGAPPPPQPSTMQNLQEMLPRYPAPRPQAPPQSMVRAPQSSPARPPARAAAPGPQPRVAPTPDNSLNSRVHGFQQDLMNSVMNFRQNPSSRAPRPNRGKPAKETSSKKK